MVTVRRRVTRCSPLRAPYLLCFLLAGRPRAPFLPVSGQSAAAITHTALTPAPEEAKMSTAPAVPCASAASDRNLTKS